MSTRTLILVAVFLSACGGSSRPEPLTPVQLAHTPVQPVQVNDRDFGPFVQKLLAEGEPSAERLNVLAGVVRHQLRRAGKHFVMGHDDAGLAAASGALLLVRAGELRPEMLEGSKQTLLAAAAVAARAGDEGGAEAFYQLVRLQLSAPERAEADLHLGALHEWQAHSRETGSMQAASEAQRAAAKRAVIERTPETLDAAHRATVQWVARAIEEARKETPATSAFEHDEHLEYRRAAAMGALTTVALYLRDGDAVAAVAALEAPPLKLISNEKLVARLESAAEGEVDAWAELFGVFEGAAASRNDAIDPALARAAAWGAAVALYRAEPLEIRAAIPISTLLVEQGLADTAPLVFRDALGPSPDARELNWALGLLFQALIQAEQQQDLALARQVFANSREVFELAASDEYRASVRPSAGEFSYLMGSMEARAGALDAARTHLERAAAEQPTPDAYRLLAAIDRQAKNPKRALESANRLIDLSRAAGQPVDEAESQLIVYDIQSESGQLGPASAALSAALKLALAARAKSTNGTETATAERVLAEVLDRYGEQKGANRAAQRAADAARNNTRQLGATLLDAARRALVSADLKEGRAIMSRALELDLESRDLVYVALWVKLLHERLNTPSDGGVEEAFSRIDRDGSWVAQLREWGRGLLSDPALLGRARTEVERVEAEFYVAARQHLKSPTSATTAQLTAVAQSRAIELIEVRIARALLAGPRTAPKIPKDVSVP